MPCKITDDEREDYEKDYYQKVYGRRELTAWITTTVACELSKIIEKHGLTQKLSPLAKKWIKAHKEEDRLRE